MKKFSAADLNTKLKNLGIKNGDTIMIHGDGIILNFINGETYFDKIRLFRDALLKKIGKNGTLLVPTFNYSFLKKREFDPLKNESQIGFFSEIFRSIEKTNRSSHPVFSFLIIGKNKKKLINTGINDCFGKNSIFKKFHDLNGKILTFGCGFNRITFAIHVEEMFGVSYRYRKYFKGIIKKKNKILKINKLSYYVRKLNQNNDLNLFNLKRSLIKEKKIQIIKFGRVSAEMVKAKDFFSTATKKLKKNPYYLIEKGAKKNDLDRNVKQKL